MSVLIALIGLALATPCEVEGLTRPEETLSVAWVSPLGKRARGWIRVARTSDIASLGDELGRTLQALGLRRSERDPGRRYKVVIFDVVSDDLCRPVEGVQEGQVIAGVRACTERLAKPSSSDDACGHAIDRETDRPSVEVFHARWRDLAREGFCVLPAERFVGGR